MPPSNTEIQQMHLDIFQVKSDLNRIDALISRLDATIERLTEVSASISQVLAVQTARLEHLEKLSDRLSQLTSDGDRKSMSFEREVHVEIERQHDELRGELKAMQKDINIKFEKLDTKMIFVERWMWLVSGGAAVVGAILAKISDKFYP